MNGFKARLRNTFTGCYGMDKFGYFLLAAYAVMCILNAMFHNKVMQILTILLAVYALYRMLSKNHVKRLAENRRFVSIWDKTRIFFKLQFDRIRYIRTDRFRRCTHCHAIVKLPCKRGSHTVRCPKCGDKFDVRLF